MGVEPFLVASSLSIVVAQRLGRKICSACAEPDLDKHTEALISAGATEEEAAKATVMKGAGCGKCGGTGYKGRVAFYEVMAMNDELKEAVLNGVSTLELAQEAERLGMLSLRRAGLKHVMAGTTSLEEVLRVTTEE